MRRTTVIADLWIMLGMLGTLAGAMTGCGTDPDGGLEEDTA